MNYTKEQKQLLTVVGCLPTIADYLEDVIEAKQLSKTAKMYANNLISQIRRFDNLLISGADLEAIEQQNEIALAFRQWDSKNYE